MTEKKIPLRRCAGCGEQKPKGELIRVVRRPDGTVALDATGRQNGRGAYLCPKKACLAKARRSGRIARGLSVSVPDEVWDAMERELEA